ncbi:Armadillo-like helical domain and Tetratricopeptide-like helical domain and Tetratricopeptide repeat-containing domain and Tetratricopeptide TPR2 repeat and Armadillo-type fold domain and Tetratricopeptide repeat and UNC-45/Ring assembly protein 3 family-containing protein [Strongyloides ratti]|uniref:TPR_REGION domain-containing protein n=1 Tax=Strongyloides ratti TaxID=34506 RepID=A0A090KYK8_STRRB|nr:Armadillo-like helical domain and Tetratricopeptide-like helical domain and Tetratricopeptide repeat-containing domain and Tetratricopeptide TPR2 repeat and Armadillo-type fold domain and Tetratricopeptide repeat and UNC-45/Ring assembly protein 3 family-containing protein [Strongyloides ratti]CEF60967.1 Armadillo-like helical domain and Tetratricopeptide-like helical domain and Tetratricopeptide repeat-containing domain and Tetratricopeptide TPR2 repeat and Armadillo-type fold domain and Tetra
MSSIDNNSQIENGTIKLSALEYKDEGNKYFSSYEYKNAIDSYTSGLQIIGDDKKLKCTLYRNRAMVRFKIDDFEGAEDDCTKALEIDGVDVKALFRRAQAREQLEKFGGALKDAKEALRLEPKNGEILKLVTHLTKINTEKINEVNSIEYKFKEMNKYAFNSGSKNNDDIDKMKKGLSNLIVMARDSEGGATIVWDKGNIVDKIINVVIDEKNDDEIAYLSLSILDILLKNRIRCMNFVEKFTIVKIVEAFKLRYNNKQIIETVGLIHQRVFNALCSMDRNKEIKPDPDVTENNKMHIIKLLLEYEDILCSPNFNTDIRETVIDLLTKNLMHMDGGIPRGWSWRFVEGRGLSKLLHVSSQIPELCEYPVSIDTRNHLAICLQRLYDDMVFDTKRNIFKEKVDTYFTSLLVGASSKEGQIKLASFLITMLQGVVDIGVNLVTNDTVLAIMLQMASSNDILLQSVAAELIVQSVSKHERAVAILKIGTPVLKTLYESTDHTVKVRALMGLCKCAAAGGDDISKATMEESAILKLAKTCKKFLLSVDKYDVDIRRFACEGLSYLTLDADIKEMIVEDKDLLKALVSLAQSAGPICVYTLASIYVNLSNAYEKPKVDEEMVKLAQFAKHHVPEVHPKDTDDYVTKRIHSLVKGGAVSACVAVSKTESKNALDLLARALLAFASEYDLRGQIVSEGGAKLLLTLVKECNPEGKIKAAHALAKIGSFSDPNITFSGQRMYEVVKPMVDLLHPDCDGLANYEALLTLTNLAGQNDSLRKRIIKERAAPKIEEYWYMDNHPQLRAAAAECLLNLSFLDEFREDILKEGTDKLKLWVLYCVEGDDDRLNLASSAGFAMFTNEKGTAKRILNEISSWEEVLKEMCYHENPEVQRRCMIGIANMIENDKDVANKIMETEVSKLIYAIAKVPDPERKEALKEATRAIAAMNMK